MRDLTWPQVSLTGDAIIGSSLLTTFLVDMDEIVVNYPSPFELMQDLQMMAENNAVIKRQPVLSRDVLISMAAIYKGIFYL